MECHNAIIFLTWSENYIIVTADYGDRVSQFAVTDTKLYVPVVTLSAQDNEKLLQQSKTSFKRKISWNKYQSELTKQTRDRYLNHLIDPSFRGVNRLFVLSVENDAHRRSYKWYFLLNVEIKDYSLLTDGKNFFGHPIKNDLITWKYSKDCHWSRRWLHNWLFARL